MKERGSQERMVNISQKIESVIRREGLDDLGLLLTPRELDEVPLVSRLHRLDFMSSYTAEEQSRVLVVAAAQQLEKILAYAARENRVDVVAMVSVLNWEDLESEPAAPVIPNFWICTNPTRDLRQFRMKPGTSPEAHKVQDWLTSAGLNEQDDVLDSQHPPSEESLRRVYVARRGSAATKLVHRM